MCVIGLFHRSVAQRPTVLPALVTAWKHRFASRCLNAVHEQAFGAKIPSYKTIQELDKKVRHFHVPPSLRVPGFGGAKMMEVVQPSIQLTMQRHIVFAIKEISEFGSTTCMCKVNNTL